MRQLLLGLAAGFAAVAALYFWKFAKRTGDLFFKLFSLAFFLLAANSVALALADRQAESRPLLYIIRLAAFATIVGAVWHKNRG